MNLSSLSHKSAHALTRDEKCYLLGLPTSCDTVTMTQKCRACLELIDASKVNRDNEAVVWAYYAFLQALQYQETQGPVPGAPAFTPVA